MYHKTILPNGIRVVTETIPYVRSVSLGFWFRTGSRNETVENNGISHLIEHLMFKGTTNRSAREIAELIDAAGGQLNAFTGKERTCYYARVLDEQLPIAAELLADMFLNSVFDPQETEKEKSVVIEEIRMCEDSPDELVHDLFATAVLGSHPLGLSVLGSEENIRAMKREDILEFIANHYVPGNLVVAAAGNVTHEQVVAQVEKYFSSLPSNPLTTNSMPLDKPGKVALKYKEIEQVHLCIGGLGVPRHDEDKFAVYVLDVILGGGMSSRLFQQLREERGLVYSTYSYHACFQDAGVFGVYAGTGPDNVRQVVHIIQDEFDRLVQEGVTPEELHRGKEQLKGSLMLGLESTAARMSRIAKSELFYEAILTPDELAAKIDAVTVEMVQRVARRLLSAPLTAAAIGPTEEVLWQAG
ncbi:MAG: M16 family metallopeptidase [Limnochordia bacterium]